MQAAFVSPTRKTTTTTPATTIQTMMPAIGLTSTGRERRTPTTRTASKPDFFALGFATLSGRFMSATKAVPVPTPAQIVSSSGGGPFRCKSAAPRIVAGVWSDTSLSSVAQLTECKGVRTQGALRKGQFVDRYLGEVITSTEADRRRAASNVTQRKDVYLFALDKFTDEDSLDPRLNGPPLEVDGEFMSGPTRFINHSCDPNMKIFARVGDHADKHIHDLALFAIKDIDAGDELTFDYVAGVDDDGGDSESFGEMTRCLCKSANCRKFLW